MSGPGYGGVFGAAGAPGGSLPAGTVEGQILWFNPVTGLWQVTPGVDAPSAGDNLIWTAAGWKPASSIDFAVGGDVGAGTLLWTRSNTGMPTVALWPDLSGSGLSTGFAQAVAANQPTIGATGPNGETAYTFDVTNDFMSAAIGVVAQPFHLFTVFTVPTPPIDVNPTFIDGDVAANTCRLYAAGAAPGSITNINFTSDGGTNLISPGDKRQWNIFEVQANGVSSRVKVNDANTVFGPAGAGAPNGIRLNDIGAAGGGTGGIRIVEFVLFSGLRTPKQSNLIHSALRGLYGLF